MAQLSVLRLITPQMKKNDHYVRDGQEVYAVEFDAADNIVTVLDTVALYPGGAPIDVNQSHPFDTRIVVKDLEAAPLSAEILQSLYLDDDGVPVANHPMTGKDCILWQITLTWGFRENPLNFGEDGNPLNKWHTWSTRNYDLEVFKFFDAEGVPYINTAYDFMDPPPVGIEDVLEVIVRKNLPADTDIGQLTAMGKKVNNAPWNGYAPKCVWVAGIDIPELIPDPVFKIWYYPMEFHFHIRLGTWRRSILNEGMRELKPGDPTKRRNCTSEGVPVTKPVMLDVNGHQLHPPVLPEQMVILYRDDFASADFGFFNLDNILFRVPTTF